MKSPADLQPCQNVPAAGNFAAFSPFLAAYSTLDFTMSPQAGNGTWCLLPTAPSMLPTATKHFDRAGFELKLKQSVVAVGVLIPTNVSWV